MRARGSSSITASSSFHARVEQLALFPRLNFHGASGPHNTREGNHRHARKVTLTTACLHQDYARVAKTFAFLGVVESIYDTFIPINMHDLIVGSTRRAWSPYLRSTAKMGTLLTEMAVPIIPGTGRVGVGKCTHGIPPRLKPLHDLPAI